MECYQDAILQEVEYITVFFWQFMDFWISSLDRIKDAEILGVTQSAKVILKRFSVNEMEQAKTPPDFNEQWNSHLKLLFEKFYKVKGKVRQHQIVGETGVFWLNYIEIMNKIEILRRWVHLLDRNTLLQCLINLSFLFFLYNKHNYARWITQYIFEQLNFDMLWPGVCELLDICSISRKRKSNSAPLFVKDMLLEATINNRSGRGQGCNLHGFRNIDGGSERFHLTTPF